MLSKAAALVPSGGTRNISARGSPPQEQDESEQEAGGRELAYAGARGDSRSGSQEQSVPDRSTQRVQAKPEQAKSGTRRISSDSRAEKADQAATQAAMDE